MLDDDHVRIVRSGAEVLAQPKRFLHFCLRFGSLPRSSLVLLEQVINIFRYCLTEFCGFEAKIVDVELGQFFGKKSDEALIHFTAT